MTLSELDEISMRPEKKPEDPTMTEFSNPSPFPAAITNTLAQPGPRHEYMIVYNFNLPNNTTSSGRIFVNLDHFLDNQDAIIRLEKELQESFARNNIPIQQMFIANFIHIRTIAG